MIPAIKTAIPGVEVVRLGAPVYAQMELTGNCQYSCPFCYNVWKDRHGQSAFPRMSEQQAFYAAAALVDARIFSVILSGGEPTLVRYLPGLVRYFTDSEVDATMISNGALLSRELAQKLSDAGLRSVQISLHHHEPAKFDQLVNYRGAHAATLNGMRNAVAVLGSENVNVNMVITAETINAVEGMINLLVSEGVEYFSASLVSSCFNGERGILGPRAVREIYSKLARYSNKMNMAFVGGMPFCSLPEDYDPDKVKMANVCDAALAQVVIGPDGSIRPCVQWPESGGNIFTDDLKDVWLNSPLFISIRRFENTPYSCRTCSCVAACHGGCRAAALLATRDILGEDPLMISEGETWACSTESH